VTVLPYARRNDPADNDMDPGSTNERCAALVVVVLVSAFMILVLESVSVYTEEPLVGVRTSHSAVWSTGRSQVRHIFGFVIIP
jgi:hypothetical protein